ncbi:HEAT repeat domain-containing protein [Sphingobacterium composti]|uniref:HEAT repeat domain-containing protein n=1 Tax=Sphingobacterium composti TaxID=363260 RepID=UPI0013587320|nr:HEAT repeat domain-containing protein [Sphingobacterium composti Ten et al. 2007 non Yoo et al. 2007]
MIFLKIELHNLTLALTALLLFVVVLIIAVLIYGYKNYQLINNAQQWKNLIEEKISYSIFNGIGDIQKDQEFEKLLKNKNFKKIFISVLIESDQRFVGDAHKILKDIFYIYKLDKLAWEKLQSNNIYQNVRGIQVMTAMNVIDAINKITHHLNHKNPYVYSEAQYSIVRLNGFEGLKFLDSLEKPLSDWQQMRLSQAIKTLSHSDFDSICQWLSNQNQTVINFALSLIRKFRIHSIHDNVINLLNHQEIYVRINAIKTLQTIDNSTTMDTLIEIYPKQENLIKVEIIKFINRTGDKSRMQFIKDILEKERDIYILIEVVNLLKKFNDYTHLQEKATDINLDSKLLTVIKNALHSKL